VIECEFKNSEGSKSVGFSHGDFGLVVEAFHDPAGNQFLRPEVVKDELTVLTQRAGDLLHGLDSGAHGLPTPLIEELAGPGRRVVLPELLKGFLEEGKRGRSSSCSAGGRGAGSAASAPRFSLRLSSSQRDFLKTGRPGRALRASCGAFPRRGYLVEGLVHFCHDVETVEDVQGLGAFLANNFQKGLPRRLQ